MNVCFEMFFKIRSASIGVIKSDRISPLTGITSYWPVAASCFTSSRSGKILINTSIVSGRLRTLANFVRSLYVCSVFLRWLRQLIAIRYAFAPSKTSFHGASAHRIATASQEKLSLKTQTSLTELLLSRTNILIRGATLIHGSSRALCRIPSYPRQVTPACASQNTPGLTRLTAPSAVHLTMCFLPDSHPRRLSVKASLPLSPHQRFSLYAIFNRDYSNPASVRQRKIITHSAAKLHTNTRPFYDSVFPTIAPEVQRLSSVRSSHTITAGPFLVNTSRNTSSASALVRTR